ncbi:MAG: DUF2157 domain-containing protein [Persicimonas sp.]
MLGEDAFSEARSLLKPDGWASVWASRALLFFGAALVLAGIIFFFAFNWADLPGLAKLSLVEVGFVACLAGATLRGTERISSRVLLVAAAVLVGVFLAVFGQIYQTGADPWQLFALWSVLMLPLVGLARTQGGWVIFGAVLSTALILFMDQRLYIGDYPRLSRHLYPGVISLVFGGLWLALEALRDRRSPDWLDPAWSRSLFASAIFGGLAFPEILHSNDWLWHTIQLSAMAAASWAVWNRHSRREFDLSVIAIGGLAWLIIAVVRFAVFLLDAGDFGGITLLVLGVFTLGTSGGLVWGLRKLAERAKEAT